MVPWPLDVRFLQLPCERLLSAGPGEHDGAPACKGVTGTSIYIHVKMKIQICEICMISHFSWRLIILSVSALAGVVCRRGYSSLLLFHCSWSSSQWTEGSKPTHLTLFLQQFLWSSQVKALKQIGTVKKNKCCWIKFFFFGGVSSQQTITLWEPVIMFGLVFSSEMLRNDFTNILQT